MVCDDCKKKKYCSHVCRKFKDERHDFALRALSKTKAGKMIAIVNQYTEDILNK